MTSGVISHALIVMKLSYNFTVIQILHYTNQVCARNSSYIQYFVNNVIFYKNNFSVE